MASNGAMCIQTMQNKYLSKLKQVVIDFLQDENVKIILFGSRARRDNSIGSDVDIGIIPHGTINSKKLAVLRAKIDDLNIPYKVEIVNFQEVSSGFKKETMKEAVVWRD